MIVVLTRVTVNGLVDHRPVSSWIVSGVDYVRGTQSASRLYPPGRYPLADCIHLDLQKLSAFAYSVR